MSRNREFDRARNLLTNDRAHAAPAEVEVHRAERQRSALDGRMPGDNRVVNTNFLALLHYLFCVDLRFADKTQWINRDKFFVYFDKTAGIDQKLNALVRSK